MQQAFLLIISILGAIYSFTTHQTKIGFGLLIIGISFIFSIPGLVTGVWADVFEAITMVVFALGVFVIVFQKKVVGKKEESSKQENE
ncbi:MAG: hypothetical protein WCV58_01935 [Patescibacteria group bacterium]|jgi:hypothetical protein